MGENTLQLQSNYLSRCGGTDRSCIFTAFAQFRVANFYRSADKILMRGLFHHPAVNLDGNKNCFVVLQASSCLVKNDFRIKIDFILWNYSLPALESGFIEFSCPLNFQKSITNKRRRSTFK